MLEIIFIAVYMFINYFLFLQSAMSMIVTIALFHGKNNLLRRRPFLGGRHLLLSQQLADARVYYYGWSFYLAWVCVVLCFVHTWVWLCKAQTMPEPRKGRGSQRSSRVRRHSYTSQEFQEEEYYVDRLGSPDY